MCSCPKKSKKAHLTCTVESTETLDTYHLHNDEDECVWFVARDGVKNKGITYLNP